MSRVVATARQSWDATAWRDTVDHATQVLDRSGTRVLVTVMDNSPAFIAIDEAALALGVVHVPLPGFFTREQIQFAIEAVGADTLWVAAAMAPHWPTLPWTPVPMAGDTHWLARRSASSLHTAPAPARPPGTAKITFTSGTTGTPKGVCLGAPAMSAVVSGLVEAMAPLSISRHLSALPYAVLLENLAGVMAARQQQATVISLPLADVGLTGSSQFQPERLDAAVRRHEPESLILLPQMLKAWTGYLMRCSLSAPSSLKMVAVGGAPVGAAWLQRARQMGIPAFEGYGLSEGASVQTLNLPWAQRDGSVGQALPHSRIRTAPDGEVEVQGSLFLGYLGQPDVNASHDRWWPTGDLGDIDADGYLTLRGRKKNVLITGFGRNVSPEWVETALMQEPLLPQVVVVGDGDARLGAVIWSTPGPPDAPDARAVDIQAAVDRVNAQLPDYARVTRWVLADPALHPNCFTANGRPRRPRVESLYRNHPAHADDALTA